MLTQEDVQHIASLARIGMDEKEINKFSTELSAILDWVKQLEEIDTNNVKPTEHITGLDNVIRKDRENEFDSKNRIIKLFPEQKDNCAKVKSVL